MLEFKYRTMFGTDITIKYDTVSDRFECDRLGFISYCEEDKPFVNNLLSYIEELNKEIRAFHI